MKKILKFLKKTYRNVLRSIAFYPVLISLLFIILALTAINLENWEVIRSIKKQLPYLFIQDYETARSILSVFIGGIISLTVFSFSMVMVVLSQASSNFSPRVLPGLISNSKHQIILGTYVGTLLYCIIVLTSLGARGIDADTMGLSTMFAAVLSVICIALFVYFIHNISGAIQIQNIIDQIFEKCKGYLSKELEKTNQESKPIDTSDWFVLKSKKTGYFRGFDIGLLNTSIKEQSNQIDILPYLNQHIWAGMPIVKTKEKVSDNDIKNLLFSVNLSTDRHEDDNGVGGLIKLMEIAVKAMSPGINDPGTAIDAIAKLGQLLAKFLQIPATASAPLNNGECIVIKHHIPAKELLRILIQPIRLYSKEDSAVLYELIHALKFIASTPGISIENKAVIIQELGVIRKDVETHIVNKADRDELIHTLEQAGQ